MTFFTTPALRYGPDEEPESNNWRIVFNSTTTLLQQAETYARGAILSAISADQTTDPVIASNYAIRSQMACDKSGTSAYEITRTEMWLITRAEKDPAISPLISIARSRASYAHSWHKRAIDAAYACRHHRRHAKKDRHPVTTPQTPPISHTPLQPMLGTPEEPLGSAYGNAGAKNAMNMALIATDGGWVAWSAGTTPSQVTTTAQWSFHMARAVEAASYLCGMAETRAWTDVEDAVKNAHMAWTACADAWHGRYQSAASANHHDKAQAALEACNCSNEAALAWGTAARLWTTGPNSPHPKAQNPGTEEATTEEAS